MRIFSLTSAGVSRHTPLLPHTDADRWKNFLAVGNRTQVSRQRRVIIPPNRAHDPLWNYRSALVAHAAAKNCKRTEKVWTWGSDPRRRCLCLSASLVPKLLLPILFFPQRYGNAFASRSNCKRTENRDRMGAFTSCFLPCLPSEPQQLSQCSWLIDLYIIAWFDWPARIFLPICKVFLLRKQEACQAYKPLIFKHLQRPRPAFSL